MAYFKETSASEFPSVDQLVKGWWIATGKHKAGQVADLWRAGGAANGFRESDDHYNAMDWYTQQRDYYGSNQVPKPPGLQSTAAPMSANMMSMGGGGGRGRGNGSGGGRGGGRGSGWPSSPPTRAPRGGPSAPATSVRPSTNFDFYDE